MEPTRTRTARDLAAAEARARPSTQFAQQYPAYPEQAQQLRRPPQQAPAQREAPPQFSDLLSPEHAPAPQQRPRAQQPAPVALRAPAAPAVRTSPVRRALGVLAFLVLTAMSLPLHVLAIFFIYVQIESPGDLETAAPLLGGLFVAVFLVLTVVGVLTQVIGGFPGRWRARVTFAFLSGVIALVVSYAAAITQF